MCPFTAWVGRIVRFRYCHGNVNVNVTLQSKSHSHSAMTKRFRLPAKREYAIAILLYTSFGNQISVIKFEFHTLIDINSFPNTFLKWMSLIK